MEELLRFTIHTKYNIEALKIKLQKVESSLTLFACSTTITETPSDVCITLLKSPGKTIFTVEDSKYIFRIKVADALAEYIIEEVSPFYIQRLVQKEAKELSPETRLEVEKEALDFYLAAHDKASLNLLMNFGRKNRLSHRIGDWFRDNSALDIDGFITFQAKDVITELKFVVEVALEAVAHRQQYVEFVSLLKHFVLQQPPKVRELHVTLDPKNKEIIMWDEKGFSVASDIVDTYIEEMQLDNIAYDDLLVSLLISLAPNKLIIHTTDKECLEDASVKIIKDVFGEKVLFSDNCDTSHIKHRTKTETQELKDNKQISTLRLVK